MRRTPSRRGPTRPGGGAGFADVWKRGHFAWEYKGKHRSLVAAYQQLLQYREDLENPPLLVVCDLNRFEVHTNFTGTAKQVYAFNLADLPSPDSTAASRLPPLEVLRALFGEPAQLRPEQTSAQVTERAVAEFARLADSLREREADLVTYWFERARALIGAGQVRRAGLLATHGIRGGANRRALERIKRSGDLFYTQADRPWILDGAAVRVSMVGFDDGSEQRRLLNESKDDPPERCRASTPT